jgi:hypothetical protein
MPIDRNSAQYITGAIYKPTQTSAPGVWDLDDQANNIAKNLWPLPPQAVQRSLRFNSADSAYLNRTFGSGNRRTWTWSAWVKRSGTGIGRIFDCFVDINNQDRLLFGDNFLWASSIGGTQKNIQSAALYRDYSAWYHLVIVADTTNSVDTKRIRMYVNGVEVSYSSPSYPTQNQDLNINRNQQHTISSYSGTSEFISCYIAEVNFIDGYPTGYDQTSLAALNVATLFAETDPQTGVWVPKRYTGTYGTNGFRLSFANNSSTAALGYDSSGQGNNWTANNFSVTPGTGNDSLVDVPSMYNTDTGLGGQVLGNYATFNPLVTQRLSLSDGNLKTNWVTSWGIALGSIAVNSGKWYFESYPDAGQWHMTGVDQPKSIHTSHVGANSTTKGIALVYDPSNTRGDISYNGNNSVYTGASTTFNTGDVVGIALDLDNNNVKFYKNNLLQYNLSNLLETGAYYTFAVSMFNGGNIYANFGQCPFAYAAPTGYRALCTTNLPAPAIGQTSNNQADNHFNVVTYQGTGTSQSITGVGFQPDLVWIKGRGVDNHNLHNSLVGAAAWLSSDLSGAEQSNSAVLASFDIDGFTVGTNASNNSSGMNFVAWCWNAGGVSVTNSAGTNNATIASTYRANKSAGFSIVTYTGNGTTGSTVRHGLSTTPAMIVTKKRSSGGTDGWWATYHTSLSASTNLMLNSTSAAAGTASWTQGIIDNISSSIFTLTSGSLGAANVNENAVNYVAYCWAAIPGYSAFGNYTGNASTDGSFVYTGFKPAFILIKDVNNANSWILMDNKRTGAYNPQDGWLVAQAPDAEYNVSTSDSRIDFLSNGFKLRNSNAGNNASRTYIYAAFAETPARLSTAR